jgi:hypothetical protein
MALPTTARYQLRFRHSDTGLVPTFTFFKRLDTLENVVPPAIEELMNGQYYFDYLWSRADDPDITFEVDGGPSIPTEEVRYIADVLSVRDYVVSASGGSGSGGGSPVFTVGR